jgi:hypothetical protein
MAALRGSAVAKASVATGLVGLGVVIDKDAFTAGIAAWGSWSPCLCRYFPAGACLSIGAPFKPELRLMSDERPVPRGIRLEGI